MGNNLRNVTIVAKAQNLINNLRVSGCSDAEAQPILLSETLEALDRYKLLRTKDTRISFRITNTARRVMKREILTITK